VRLRDLTDGWLTPARLAADALALPRSDGHQSPLTLVRGVFAAEPTRAADGALSLRAEPEVDRPDNDAPPDPAALPISEAERVRRIVAYRDYLKSEGLTPLRDALAAPEAPETPKPERADNPYQ
jgi:hypothetical protein